MEPDVAPDPRLKDLSNITTPDNDFSLSSQKSVSGGNTPVSQTLDEIKADASDRETSGSTSAVEYYYLAFSTTIPTAPVLPLHLTHIAKDLPPCPNLHQYDNPFDWSIKRKWLITVLSCSVNAVAAYGSGAYASPERQLTEKWGIGHVEYNLGITIFTAGFGIAPMVCHMPPRYVYTRGLIFYRFWHPSARSMVDDLCSSPQAHCTCYVRSSAP
jgi:hypothetical protein